MVFYSECLQVASFVIKTIPHSAGYIFTQTYFSTGFRLKLFQSSINTNSFLILSGCSVLHAFMFSLCLATSHGNIVVGLYSVSPFSVLPVYYLCIPFIFMNKAQGYVSISQIYAAATYVDTQS